jgi:hypothetical protein
MASPAEETSPLQTIQNAFEQKAVKHPEFDLEKWVYHAGTNFRTSANEVVCHISKYVTDEGQHLFIISDHSKILSPVSLKKPVNLTNVPPAWRQPISNLFRNDRYCYLRKGESSKRLRRHVLGA